jgi:hypothetical protein
MTFFGFPNVKLLGMWSWRAKALANRGSCISNFTFLRSIRTAAPFTPKSGQKSGLPCFSSTYNMCIDNHGSLVILRSASV